MKKPKEELYMKLKLMLIWILSRAQTQSEHWLKWLDPIYKLNEIRPSAMTTAIMLICLAQKNIANTVMYTACHWFPAKLWLAGQLCTEAVQ